MHRRPMGLAFPYISRHSILTGLADDVRNKGSVVVTMNVGQTDDARSHLLGSILEKDPFGFRSGTESGGVEFCSEGGTEGEARSDKKGFVGAFETLCQSADCSFID